MVVVRSYIVDDLEAFTSRRVWSGNRERRRPWAISILAFFQQKSREHKPRSLPPAVGRGFLRVPAEPRGAKTAS